MKLKSAFAGFLSLVMAAVLLAGCANQMEPAKKAIADIEAAVAAAGPDAAQYIPDQLQAVTSQVAEPEGQVRPEGLQGRARRGSGAAHAGAGPLLLRPAPRRRLPRRPRSQALNAEWGTLSADIPAQLAAVTSRVGILSKSKKLPAGLDAAAFDAAAKSGVDEATALWEPGHRRPGVGQHGAGRRRRAPGEGQAECGDGRARHVGRLNPIASAVER